MHFSPRITLVALAFCTPLTAAVAQHGSTMASIPQVARTAGQFTTLLAAVDAAGLTETLLGRGPFTLVAPTDEAFAKLPNGTVQDLLKPENREKLRTILTYHVIAGRVTASQARNVSRAATVAGQDLRISRRNDELRINDATVAVYEVATSALLSLGNAVPGDAQRALRQALGDTSGSTRDRAFTLRGGLDQARRSLTGQMQMAGTR